MTARAIRGNDGFTLIEILTVTAIISVLAAILVPVFAQARESSRQTTCLSNMKQLLTAEGLYLQDHEEAFPRLRLMPDPPGGYPPNKWALGIQDFLNPYIKNADVWKCPSDGFQRVDCQSVAKSPGAPISYSFTHYQSGFDMGTGFLQTAAFGLHAMEPASESMYVARVGRLAETISVFELWSGQSMQSGIADWKWDVRDIASPGAPTAPDFRTLPWCGGRSSVTNGAHHGKGNFGFVDGHVKALDRKSLMPWPWNPAAIAAREAAGQSNRNLLHWSGKYK